VATTILGLEESLNSVDGPLFSKALKILSASDEAKFSWGAEELKEEDAEVEEVLTDIDTVQKKAKDKLKEIGKKCTRHEKKLLGGVVLPNDIRTTFTDIRAPEETIEALKTLTSLSLIRPEAFSYGVLATDKISGLLLYGPPGTGKTLLAKAVAKESGATVLEISGAELNDMFVG
jgi:SpoVK/Ycf46/Vps4 family AAA+-type ATPase